MKKNKKLIISCIIAATALSICSVCVLALDFGDDNSGFKFIDHSSEIVEAMNNGKLPDIQYTKEEKEYLIEKRKADKIKYGTKSELEIAREEGREDEYWAAIEEREKIFSTEEGKKLKAQMDKINEEQERKTTELLNAAISLVTDSGFYPEGIDSARIGYDEDYMLDFVMTVCKVYSERKQTLSSSEKSKIEEYLNAIYDTITCWLQSEKTMDTYEMIEKTIKVRFLSTSVERR